MKKICLVFGGDSLENEISILTALKVKDELIKYSYPFELVYLDHDGNFYGGEGLINKNNYHHKLHFKKGEFINKNDEYYFKYGFKKVKFDLVFLLCHGLHAEDGTVGGYFDTLKIPCLYPGLEVSSILQNKTLTKKLVNIINIPVTKSITLLEREYKDKIDLIDEKLSYPLIVKPNYLGSSIGVRKVLNKKDLNNSLFEVFRYDNSALIEECVENLKEINVAIFRYKDKLITSEVERVNNDDKVLSFYDKYDNYSFNDSHIIPADIPSKILKKVLYYSKRAYNYLDIKSVVRFDFLFDQQKNEVYLNEINAIPGSLSYYLFEKQDIKMIDLIEMLIEQYYLDYNNQKRKIYSYKEDFLSTLKEK